MLKCLEVTAVSAFGESQKRVINLDHVVQVTSTEGADWGGGARVHLSSGDAFQLADKDTTRMLEALRGSL